ncbi:MAG TPA: family 10 glycosylhydrolase [Oligoflexia bacterium]|nr:family 10 glycosylhydrolase [Oligoflexia bacterium]HMP48522.1 family 10 glycosylhydrolase [Oligoflexia bacterium]
MLKVKIKYIFFVVLILFSQSACAELGFLEPPLSAEDRAKLEAFNKRRGLWVEAEGVVRPLSNPQEFSKLLLTLDSHRITDVYVQIYRRGRAWFPSKVADNSPYLENQLINFDPLKELLSFCEQKNIRVHAWVNALRLGEDHDLPFLKQVGRDAVLVDGGGRSLFDNNGKGVEGCRPDTPGIWLDPLHEEVKDHLVTVLRELTELYPTLSGVHYDYLRYPYSIKGEAKERLPDCGQFIGKREFEKKQGSRGALISSAICRECQSASNEEAGGIAELLRSLRDVVKERDANLEISSAVLPDPYLAQKNTRQDWSNWLNHGLLDSVVSMNYTKDKAQFFKNAKLASKASKGKIMIGLGAWLALRQPSLLADELDSIKFIEKEGVVLFSYANLSNNKGKRLYQIMDQFP